MLLKLEKLIAKYGMKITGVIQAGAHEGQEVHTFVENGIKSGILFEPCIESFKVLEKVAPLYFSIENIGLSSFDGYATMNKESQNKGQSNSFLKPKIHLQYYPDIVFTETEDIGVLRLDFFQIDTCNFLMMDVQGYELNVLKGATETLKHIDYIYTEVNREELYENCAMVEDLDNYLTDFRRVETKWKRKGFGDALYIAKRLL